MGNSEVGDGADGARTGHARRPDGRRPPTRRPTPDPPRRLRLLGPPPGRLLSAAQGASRNREPWHAKWPRPVGGTQDGAK
jgi:hypothetical protein